MKQLFYSPIGTDKLKQEKQKARELRKTLWWKEKIQSGLCHYCRLKFHPEDLTMDHVVALGRGGTSSKGNVVPSCKNCNTQKAHQTPAEILLSKLL